MKTPLICVLALTLVLALAITGMPQGGAISIRVNVVSLESVVVDANGRPITSLKKGDFKIYEDGESRPIRNFSSVEAPYSILLLFQNTPTINSVRPFLADASNTFLQALRPQDRISIYTIEFSTKKVLDWRNAQNGKIQEVTVRPPNGSLALYDSISQVFNKLSDVAGRKGIIVMTDGADNALFQDAMEKGSVPAASEDKPFEKTVQKVRERSIPLYFVAINTDRNLFADANVRFPGMDQPYLFLRDMFPKTSNFRQIKHPSPTLANDFLVESRSRMETLAEVSGGQIYFPKSLDDVVPLYEEIAKELGTSYSFGYTPHNSESGTTHRIEVRVSDPNLRVIQSRHSYTTR